MHMITNGKPCGRPDGHTGSHRSAASVERHQDYVRFRRAKGMGAFERASIVDRSRQNSELQSLDRMREGSRKRQVASAQVLRKDKPSTSKRASKLAESSSKQGNAANRRRKPLPWQKWVWDEPVPWGIAPENLVDPR